MIILQSYVPNTRDIRSNHELVAKQALLSCKFLKKHRYTTVLYTTKELKDTLFVNHPYDNIIDITWNCDDFKTLFWCGTKLISCQMSKEPYYHVDTDLFLINDILKNKEEPFLAFHVEPYTMKVFQALTSLLKEYGVNITDQVYNCAIFGGTSIDVINNTINFILSKVLSNFGNINGILARIEDHGNPWKKSVFIEQILLTNQIRKQLSLNVLPTLIDTFNARGHVDVYSALKKEDIIHFWSAKNSLERIIGIYKLLDYMEKYYF